MKAENIRTALKGYPYTGGKEWDELKELERLASIAEKAEIARKEANNVIYFDDNSDYRRSLWEICKILGMDDEEIGMEYLED